MILNEHLRELIQREVAPKLARLRIQIRIGAGCDPDMGDAQEDCLYVWGWSDGLYRMVRTVDEILLEVDEAFADLLVVVADASAHSVEAPAAVVATMAEKGAKRLSWAYLVDSLVAKDAEWTPMPHGQTELIGLEPCAEGCLAA